MSRVIRHMTIGILVSALVASCAANRTVATDDLSPPTTASTTSTASTTTTVTTTSVAVTTTTAPSYEFVVWAAPADGQWFNELPIPWVYTISPPDTGPPPEPVPGSSGWTRDAAVVTVNGHPTTTEECNGCMYQQGRMWAWQTIDGSGDPHLWVEGSNVVIFEAAFGNDVVVDEVRTIHYDPTLETLSGWMVDLDTDNRTITFAAAALEPAEDDGTDIGPVTSVAEYQVRADAVFILLDVDSGGEPPATAVGFDDFADLAKRAHAGECDECFYGSWPDTMFALPDSEPGGKNYFVMYLQDNTIQQLEQIWSP